MVDFDPRISNGASCESPDTAVGFVRNGRAGRYGIVASTGSDGRLSTMKDSIFRWLRLTRAAGVMALVACSGVTAQSEPAAADLVTMEIHTVGMDTRSQSPVVLLTEPASGRHLPIMVGLFEAQAIARAMERVSMPRPMTHDLLADMIRNLGAEVEEVVVHTLRDGTYFGTIRLSRNPGGPLEIDSRPSDALALAIRVNAPIRVARHLLDDPPDIEFRATPPGQVVFEANQPDRSVVPVTRIALPVTPIQGGG
jgi:bifunctional DNase/RNase